jgi:hypothetical protein
VPAALPYTTRGVLPRKTGKDLHRETLQSGQSRSQLEIGDCVMAVGEDCRKAGGMLTDDELESPAVVEAIALEIFRVEDGELDVAASEGTTTKVRVNIDIL